MGRVYVSMDDWCAMSGITKTTCLVPLTFHPRNSARAELRTSGLPNSTADTRA